jgi:hypothetical protein
MDTYCITKGKAFATLRLARIRGSAGNLKAARAISNLERLTPRLVCRFAFILSPLLSRHFIVSSRACCREGKLLPT